MLYSLFVSFLGSFRVFLVMLFYFYGFSREEPLKGGGSSYRKWKRLLKLEEEVGTRAMGGVNGGRRKGPYYGAVLRGSAATIKWEVREYKGGWISKHGPLFFPFPFPPLHTQTICGPVKWTRYQYPNHVWTSEVYQVSVPKPYVDQ